MFDRLKSFGVHVLLLLSVTGAWMALATAHDAVYEDRSGLATECALFGLLGVALAYWAARYLDRRASHPIGTGLRMVLAWGIVASGLMASVTLSIVWQWLLSLPYGEEPPGIPLSIPELLAGLACGLGLFFGLAAMHGRKWGAVGVVIAWWALLPLTFWGLVSFAMADPEATYPAADWLVVAAVFTVYSAMYSAMLWMLWAGLAQGWENAAYAPT